MVADCQSLRVMCFEMMQNHVKYGTGCVLYVSVSEPNGDQVRVAFESPGDRILMRRHTSRWATKESDIAAEAQDIQRGWAAGFTFARHWYCHIMAKWSPIRVSSEVVSMEPLTMKSARGILLVHPAEEGNVKVLIVEDDTFLAEEHRVVSVTAWHRDKDCGEEEVARSRK